MSRAIRNFRDHISKQFAEVAQRFTKLFADNDNDDPKVIKLADLRPTQIAVGMKQVDYKQQQLRKLAKDPEDLEEFILDRPIRVVLGPGGRAYVIDHHHLALALIREGFDTAPVLVDADYSKLSPDDFWQKMKDMKYVHPYDENGKLRPYGDIPKKITDLKDDPYRSLAGYARNAGAFKKVRTPFAEFKWADYFRTRIDKKLIEDDFDKALRQAEKLAALPDASNLPGYIPPKNDKNKTRKP